MKKEDILRGIAAYRKEQKILMRIIRKNGSLSQHDFDRIFVDISCIRINNVLYPKIRKPKLRFIPSSEEAFFLGNLSIGQWSKWLHLLHLMCHAGIAACTQKDDVVYYSEPGVSI